MRPSALAAAAALIVCVSGCSSGSVVAPPAPAVTAAAAPTPTPQPTPTPVPQLSLGGLFHPAAPIAPDPSHVRTLIATGDIIPARQTNVMQARNGWTWAFAPTADYVKDADITYVNLESPLFAGCQTTSQGFQFCGDARNVQGLQLIGAKVANLA